MAFERVTCEIYFVVNVQEIYSELRTVHDYRGMKFESKEAAEAFLESEGYIRETGNGFGWKKPQAYRGAYVTRHLREI